MRVETSVEAVMAKAESGQVRSPPPLSQDPATVKNSWVNLNTHPDLVAALFDRLKVSIAARARFRRDHAWF